MRPMIAVLCLLMAVGCGGGGGGGGSSTPAATGPVDNGDLTVQVNSSSIDPLFDDAFVDFHLLTEAINDLLILPRDIVVSFEDCGEVNSWYSPTTVKITMCYDLFDAMMQFQGWDVDTAVNAYLFVFFHELGHALIDQLDLPVIGGEEAAADAIATSIMVDAEEPESAIRAGQFFAGLPTGENAWADVHPMGTQRAGNLACWAIGGEVKNDLSTIDETDPYIVGVASDLSDAGRDCVSEYVQQDDSASTLMKDYIKTP